MTDGRKLPIQLVVLDVDKQHIPMDLDRSIQWYRSLATSTPFPNLAWQRPLDIVTRMPIAYNCWIMDPSCQDSLAL